MAPQALRAQPYMKFTVKQHLVRKVKLLKKQLLVKTPLKILSRCGLITTLNLPSGVVCAQTFAWEMLYKSMLDKDLGGIVLLHPTVGWTWACRVSDTFCLKPEIIIQM